MHPRISGSSSASGAWWQWSARPTPRHLRVCTHGSIVESAKTFLQGPTPIQTIKCTQVAILEQVRTSAEHGPHWQSTVICSPALLALKSLSLCTCTQLRMAAFAKCTPFAHTSPKALSAGYVSKHSMQPINTCQHIPADRSSTLAAAPWTTLHGISLSHFGLQPLSRLFFPSSPSSIPPCST